MNASNNLRLFLCALSLCLGGLVFGQSNSLQPGKSLSLSAGGMDAVAQMVSDSFGAPTELIMEFIQEAQRLESREGIPAVAFMGMAILESAGFSSYLYQNARNPFGMRATPPYKGPTFIMWHEGKESPFRKYETPRQAMNDFTAFLKSRRWFKDVLACPDGDIECFLTAMSANPAKKEPGYATDPEWANKIRKVIAKYGLERIK